jgi:hypothetical protein
MARFRYHVPMVYQSTSPVCWLACAVMIMQFRRGVTPSTLASLGIREDWDFRASSIPNPNRNNDHYHERLRHLGFTLAKLQPRPRGCAPSDEEYVHWLLRERGPLILNHRVGSFWYGATRVPVLPKGTPKDPPGMPRGGHAVVITGYDTDLQRIYFNNPWGDVDVPTTESSILGAIRQWEGLGYYPLAYLA